MDKPDHLPSQQPALIGSSAALRQLDADLTDAARSTAKVLITGESGVGKEVAARIIQLRSPRRDRAFVTLNCAGLPDTLLETELFGHVRGSFTGAYRDKQGLLQMAHLGTVFLDEIGEMSLRMQALLLRFLETGEIQQVGATRVTDPLDVRVICATHRDLQERVRDGSFRADLFYRLNVIHVHIPPLRERREDVADLVRHFCHEYAAHHRRPAPAIEAAALERLVAYDWPGNVRELRNVVERLVLKGEESIGVLDLPAELRLPAIASGEAAAPGEEGPTAVARRLLTRIIQHGESYWDVVHTPFLSHDLTRQHVRLVVSFGLEQTDGRYTGLTKLFNLPSGDYKRFVNALRKYDCLVPSHPYRYPGSSASPADAEPGPPRLPREIS